MTTRYLAQHDDGTFLIMTYHPHTVVVKIPFVQPSLDASPYTVLQLLQEKYGWQDVKICDRDGTSWARCVWRNRKQDELGATGTGVNASIEDLRSQAQASIQPSIPVRN